MIINLIIIVITVVEGSDNGEAVVCGQGQLTCADGTQCYSVGDQCDKIFHCIDKSDEADCSMTCEPGELPCVPDKTCLPAQYKCDGMIDCPDNSDEDDCNG